MFSFLTKLLGNSKPAGSNLGQADRRPQHAVADRQRSEPSVLQTAEHLCLALRSAEVGTWNWDVPSNSVVWDEMIHPLFGLQPGEFGGTYEDFLRLVHPEDRERVSAEVTAALEQHAEYETEFRVVWPRGSVHHLQCRGKVYHDPSGRPIRMAGVCWDVTGEAKAERALKDSEALYSSLVDSLPLHVLRKDLEGRITFVNRLFADLLSKPREDLLGKTDFDFFPQELAEKYRADDRRLVETGGLFEDVEENRTDGRVRYFHVLKSPVRDASGTIVGTQAVFWDVTARKHAEKELERERYLLRTLLDNLPDNIYFKDAESRFLTVSDALARRLSLKDPSEALGKSDYDFFPQPYAQQAREDELRMMQTGEMILGKEEQPVWPNGEESWVLTTKSVLRDPQGEVVGTFGISRDITAIKQAQQAVRDSEKRIRLVVDTALDAFVAMDPDGTIIDWNPQAERTFGWSREEAIGRELAETIIPPKYRERHREGLNRFLETGAGPVLNQRIEVTALHRDGREFPVELTIAPLWFQDGYVFNAFVHDITQRKHAAEAMHEAKEAAEAANRAKSDFLANMSHEIRTPMNAIMGMTELVLDTDLSPEQREYLTTVSESAESLLSVLNDILDFSKIEAGKLSLEKSRLELRDCLGDTMKLLAPRAHRGNLELACHIASDVPDALIGDAGRLRQIIVNLVGNALKFTEQGEVVLDVACASRTDREAELHFAVTDTGIGIPEDKLQVIFRAFEQADTSSTRRFAGTGLGLTISSTLVELMGGRMWVESEVGRGSTFHFTARLALAQGTDRAVPRPGQQQIVRGTRVLVVDDNATNRKILDEVLLNWGMQPTTVANAADAVSELRAAWERGEPFPLVITDVNMPQMDGFELTEKIKHDPELSSTVILMLTSGDRPGDISRCETVGAAAYLMKPVKQSELFDALMVALGVTESEDTMDERETQRARAIPTMRILLAEDSLPNQKLAVGLLSKFGQQVTVVHNGLEALAALESQTFDVVLMDVQMPEMDGLEATRALRRREQTSGNHVPVIAMTAHAMKGDREECLEAGMDDYVSKPIRVDELIRALERLQEKRAPQEQSPESSAAREVDWEASLGAVHGDTELLKDVAAAFLEEYPLLLQQLETALSEQDTPVVRRCAHTIKGTMRTFAPQGATYGLAEEVEQMGSRGDLAGAAERLSALQDRLKAVAEELSTFRATGAGPDQRP